MIRKTTSLAAVFFLTILPAFAQETSRRVEMADILRDNGKIYVVVAVLLTIFAGIIFYLVRLDKKITKLEKGD